MRINRTLLLTAGLLMLTVFLGLIFWPNVNVLEPSQVKSQSAFYPQDFTQRLLGPTEVPLVAKPSSEEFSLAQDLYAFYELKRNAKDPTERILATRALNLCGDFFIGYDELRNPPDIFPNAIPEDFSAEKKTRMLNAKVEFFSRCKGFLNVRKGDRLALLREEQKRLLEFDQQFQSNLSGDKKQFLEAQQTLQRLIEDKNAYALELLAESIVNQRPENSEIASAERGANPKLIGFRAALCDFGMRCEANSHYMLAMCMSSALCGDFLAVIKELIGTDEKLLAEYQHYKKEFTEALNSRDASKLLELARKS